jgi:hypothetical protein
MCFRTKPHKQSPLAAYSFWQGQAGSAPLFDHHREIARRFGPDRVEALLALLDGLESTLAERPGENRPTRQKA